MNNIGPNKNHQKICNKETLRIKTLIWGLQNDIIITHDNKNTLKKNIDNKNT